MKYRGGIIIKKIVFFSLIFIVLLTKPTNIFASNTIQARIGNRFFDTLEEAIIAAGTNDIITLTSNVSLDDTLPINKNVNINLNNFNITANEKVFEVEGGSLNLSGTGKVIETNPYYGAIVIKGSDDPNKNDYSTISVGSGITLEGWSGIFIDHNDNNTGYGILVNMNGDINAKDDFDGGPGAGIYVNGNIKHQNNAPIINLSDTVNITSTGNGIYSAGYATYNINGATISGVESGLGIKSGSFNIFDGTIRGTGEDKTPTSGNNNGINPSGASIQIESNPGYSGNIDLMIKNGLFESNDSNVIYEYTVNGNTTQVKDIELNGGTYTSKVGKDVFRLSDSFKNNHSSFISGGTYSSNPTTYLKSGYSVNENDSQYEVISSTISVFGENNNDNNSITPVLIILALAIIGIIVYLNRKKIF